MALKKEWTTPDRYKKYTDWDEDYLQELHTTVQNSPWRLGYHIQPNTGLLNDPNGFSYFNGKWHLFYQAYPIGPVHGVKSWAHLTSTNLVDWHDEGLALEPDSVYDSHGVYSGSALPVDDRLLLAYTGNVRNEKWNRQSYQLGAWMSADNSIEKINKPLITSPPTGYTHEFRDPQIIPYNNEYLLVIGAQTTDNQGKALTYSSDNLMDWSFNGELHFTNDSMGFMVECPNLVFSNDKSVLLFCPQGMDKSICHYDNIYPNMYVIGDKFDIDSNSLTNPSQLKNLDEGFDVYATQAFNAPDGRALAVSWVGLPEIEYPTDEYGWAHCLSLVKELSIKNNKLYQLPVCETKELRANQSTLKEETLTKLNTHTHAYELDIDFNNSTNGAIKLMVDDSYSSGLDITFDLTCGKMTIDRSHVGKVFGEEFGTTREFSINGDSLHLQIFVDESIVEIFINHGEQAATMRVFPEKNNTHLFIESDKTHSSTIYELRQTN